MGAGASACGDSSEIYSALMMKWDALLSEPQFEGKIHVEKPNNYDELLKIRIPQGGAEREFFSAMREYFQSLVGSGSAVIEIPLHDGDASGARPSSLQDAFKNRPHTAKKRPNKKLQKLQREQNRESASIVSVA